MCLRSTKKIRWVGKHLNIVCTKATNFATQSQPNWRKNGQKRPKSYFYPFFFFFLNFRGLGCGLRCLIAIVGFSYNIYFCHVVFFFFFSSEWSWVGFGGLGSWWRSFVFTQRLYSTPKQLVQQCVVQPNRTQYNLVNRKTSHHYTYSGYLSNNGWKQIVPVLGISSFRLWLRISVGQKRHGIMVGLKKSG